MKKSFLLVLAALAVLLVSSVAMAADGTAPADNTWIIALSAMASCIGVGLAALGGGIGMGIAVNGTVLGSARNPEMQGKLMTLMLIGLALIESVVIYTLVIALILLYANPFV